MAENDRPLKRTDRPADTADSPSFILGGDDSPITADDFQASFGEDIRTTLNIDTWRVGADLSREYERIEREVRDAVEKESKLEQRIRDKLFPTLKTRTNAPKNAGHQVADLQAIASIHSDLLFRGGVEACDGLIQVHDTLPLTIYQIGVSLVSYQGDQGTWCQRLYRKDLHQSCDDPVSEATAMLERRSKWNRFGDRLGELARKVILAYAERAILLHRSRALWRMGHGDPVPYELLTGGSNLELMVAATTVLRDLVERHQKFVFVASEPRDRVLMTVAQALGPWQFAIVQTLEERVEDWLHQRRFTVDPSGSLTWDDAPIRAAEWIPRFIKRVASQIVVGVFRAAAVAPAQVFYAHVDHADVAAHVVLADSMLQEHRGFPMLADLAGHVCRTVFGDSLDGLAENAYAAAGVPWRYLHRQRN